MPLRHEPDQECRCCNEARDEIKRLRQALADMTADRDAADDDRLHDDH